MSRLQAQANRTTAAQQPPRTTTTAASSASSGGGGSGSGSGVGVVGGGGGDVERLAATIGAIEMGFPVDRVKRVQIERQATTGGQAYENTEELVEALMSLPD